MATFYDNIRRENAESARDLEYLRESYKDDTQDLLERNLKRSTPSKPLSEIITEDKDAMDKLDIENEDMVALEEVSRIVKSSEDMTFDEMAGIDNLDESSDDFTLFNDMF